MSQLSQLPKSVRSLIIGGGIIGSSMAYHLSLHKEWKDVALLEQGVLTCGTTWHAAGLIGQMRSTSAEITLSKYGSELYSSLEKKGYPTSWKQCGSVSLSSCSDRLIHLKRNLSRAKSFGIEAEIISGREAHEKFPLIDPNGINAALWLPNDGTVVSSDCSMALAKAAKDNGAKIFENTKVMKLKLKNGVVTGVETSRGSIDAEVVLLCGGLWSRYLLDYTALHPCYHMYIVTEDCGAAKSLPVLRDLDGLIYAREWSGGLCIGGFELKAKPCFVEKPAEDLQFHLFDEDWEQFNPLLNGAMKRFPMLEKVGIRQFLNGPESFTPDNAYILGESPDVKNLYLACGFNSSGIASAGGAGLALSEWIMNGRPTRDLWTVDPRRFAKFQGTKEFLLDRVSETLGLHYTIPYPLREFATARNLRLSPLYNRLKEKNALFGTKFGWERANVFTAPNYKILSTWPTDPVLQEFINNECLHTRQKVSVFDQTSFSKYLLQGKDSVPALQLLCCNSLDVEIGKIVYTPMLNEEGGYEADVTISRIDSDQFLIVSSTANSVRDMNRIRRILSNSNFNATITDVTSSYTVLGVMGPHSRKLLEIITEKSLSNESFPFSTTQELPLGMAVVRVNRITYVGCLGYELYIPSEMMQYVYELLCSVSQREGIELKDAGYYCIETLRLEKGYRAWGNELKCDISPYESGLAFTVKLDKGNFIGRDALIKQKENGITRKIVSLTIDNIEDLENCFLLGDEPVLRNGELVGYVTSVKYSPNLKKWCSLAIIEKTDKKKITNNWLETGEYVVEVFQNQIKAKVHLKSPYDPKNNEILN